MPTTQPGVVDTASNLFEAENRASTTLNGSIDNSTTTVVVTDGGVFPASGRFVVTIENEILIVASRSGNTLTIESRGGEGSAAAAHASGETVGMQFTAGMYETLRDAIIGTQEGALFNWRRFR